MFSFFKKNTQTSAPKSSDNTAEKTTVQVVKSTVKTTQVTPANKPAKKPTVAKTLTPAQKKEQDELNKCISDFSTIMRNERIGDLTVDCTRENLLNTDKIFTLVIFATKCYFSTNILEGLKKYVPNGIPVVFALDRTIKKNKEVYSKIKELEAYENVASFYFSRGMTAKDRLQHVLPRISSKFVGIFTPRDKINVRSFQQVIENQLNANADADIFSFNGGFNLASTKNASVSGLSGLFFNKNFLEKSLNAIQNNADYWLGFYLLNQSKNANVKCVEDKEKYWLSVNTDDYSVPDLSFFMRDSIDVLKNLCKDTDSINLFVDYVIEYLQNSVAYKKCSDNKIALVASGCAILCSSIKKYYSTEEWRKIIYRFCVIFDFDQITKKAFIQNIHKKAVTSIISVKKDVVAVLETDFMQDLKESLLPALEKKYTVIYESKPQYYD